MDLVAIKVEFTIEDKTIKECFSISASAQDQDVRSLAKITCREANLPVHCQRLVQQAVVDQILAFRTAQGTSSHGPKVAHTERLEKLRSAAAAQGQTFSYSIDWALQTSFLVAA